ncbi:LOW QUALITY PROTEIN: origin recognition complex subunit 2-like [Scylla paramamosain]|uniref:LOW QUALITY PROTEIN: origin recognition complex subunit 2-like n=1 Tax=Scylla paramamosain TaxID=85552 RepID=UPI003083E6A2
MVRARLHVKFLDDANVEKVKNKEEGVAVRISAPLSQRNCGRTQSSCNGFGYDGVELPTVQETDEDNRDVFFKPTELLGNEENHIRTATVFGFHTPKKRLSMLEKAGSATKTGNSPRTPHTPHSTHKVILVHQGPHKTPNSAIKNTLRTPKSARRLSVAPDAQTPYTFRKRVKNRITQMVCDETGLSSDEDSDYKITSSESESDADNSETEDGEFQEISVQTPGKTPKRLPHLTLRTKPGTPKTPSRTPRRATKIKDVNMVINSEDYFIANGNSKKITTSDHTLSHLKTSGLSADILQSALSELAPSHPKERQALLQEHVASFPRWMTFLCEGFSLFLYGLGSKKQLISMFQEECLTDYDHIVVNGFFPSLSLKSILNNITEDILDNCGGFRGVPEQLEYIKCVYSRATANPLFIIVHNLDGPMLRAAKTQSVLANLAALTSIHLVASFDHINAPLMLDSIKMRHYNALWIDATTLDHYSEETSFENSLLLQQSASLTLSSLIHVFKSLTPNGKGIFLLLAKYQTDQKDNSSYMGMSFVDLRQRCWEKFLVNSDLSLRAQLTEFKDHKLIRFKKGTDGVETIIIPLDEIKLKDFIEQQELSEM